MTSIADSLRQEGKEQGMQQGLYLAMRAMLMEGIDEAKIAKITQINREEIRLEAKKLKAKASH